MTANKQLPALVLDQRRVLIARPEERSQALSNCLAALGAQCEVLPAIEIQSIGLDDQRRQQVLQLDQYDHVIAVSAHAARFAMEAIDQFWPQLPVGQQFYAIGDATESVFQEWQIPVLTPSSGNTSEDLLRLPTLQQLKNQKVLLLKGEGGRELIRSQLIARGAKIDELELYRRVCPRYPIQRLEATLREFAPEILITLSGDTLQNLLQLAQQIDVDLTRKMVIVPSKRVADLAREQGFKLVYVPKSLKPIDIVQSIATSGR